jgi:hypothetical protein
MYTGIKPRFFPKLASNGIVLPRDFFAGERLLAAAGGGR